MAEHTRQVSTADVLKKFAQRVTAESTKERIAILEDVAECISNQDFPENGIKGIFKYLSQTIGLYWDSGSRNASLKVIKSATRSSPGSAIKCTLIVLKTIAETQRKSNYICLSTSGASLYALSWACTVWRQAVAQGVSDSGEDFAQLIGIHCDLVCGALAAGKKSISDGSYRKLASIWRTCPTAVQTYAKRLQSLEPSPSTLCMVGLLMKYLASVKQRPVIAEYKDSYLELYNKQILGSRTNLPVHILISCKELLRHATHDDFKEKILPTFKKAMLRNPEVVLQAIRHMLADLTLDLSQYIQDIAKPLSIQLTSKDEITRAEAAIAIKNLASQCSNPEAVEKLVTILFALLNGSEGKLTVADQRISALQGIGNTSFNTVTGATALQNLSDSVSELFIPLLQQEAHEGTLVHALSMLSIWCQKFYTRVPDKLIQWFKKGISLKTSTSAVRNAYIQCMNASFHGDTVHQAIGMIPILIQTVEKASNQLTQTQLIAEAVSAAQILAKLSLVDIQAEAKLDAFWNILLDVDKQLLSDKFLTAVGNDVLQSTVTLSEKLILEYPQKMTEVISKPYYRAIIFCLNHKSWCVRRHTIHSVKRLLSLLGGTAISLALVSEFKTILASQKLTNNIVLPDEKDVELSLDQNKYVSPRILSQALMALTCVPKADPKDAESIAMATMIASHHPCVVAFNEDTWVDIIRQLRLNARNFIKGNITSCLTEMKTGKKLEQSIQNTVKTLVRIAPGDILPSLVEYVVGLLDNPSLRQVTREEYGIFCCPEGELFNRSLLESLEKSTEMKDSNIRRENKLYSYEEQMADLELKKELEKKKGKPAKAPPKLTKKQEEQLQAQLKKESGIRKNITELDENLCCACQLLRAAYTGDKFAVCQYMKTLCGVLVPLVKSPLTAKNVSQILLDLGMLSFEDENLGFLVSYTTMRLLEPECGIDKEWTQESQWVQTVRAIDVLFAKSVSQTKDPDKETEWFPGSTFAFVFYLLNCALSRGGEIVKGDESTMLKCLQIIFEHAQMRSDTENEAEIRKKYDPELLPHKRLERLLLDVIGTGSAKLQQSAASALVEVCDSISGEEGCAIATKDDIEVLLLGLKSPCTAVRDSALQGLHCLTNVLPNIDDSFELGLHIAQRIWVASYDKDDNIRKLAESLREDLLLEEPYEEMCLPLIDDLIHPEEIVRNAAAETLAKTLDCHSESISPTMQQLMEKYIQKLEKPPPILDGFGRLMSEQPPDEWPARCGIAVALEKLSPLLSGDQVEALFSFFVPKALGDESPEVQKHMRDAALQAISDHGKDNVSILLPLFENFLADAPSTATYDSVRQSIVILMGSLAKHLDKDNPKVKPIVAQLISTLSTPSEEVQNAVANCLPPLVPAIKQGAPELVQEMLRLLLDAENTYGERKGAAYGLAGLVRGLGITALKQLEIMPTLQEAVKDKKNPRRREGALFAYEMLCRMLGKLFEPYVVHILPLLLLCFGDGSQYVREAADDTAKAVMSMLTAHGVKLVLPSLLKGLEEESWRTKTGAVELLGAMAFCAPKQLSACLPNIVPKITDVLTDSHIKVQKAGAQALRQIGSVIKNPEIQAIVPVLLDALQEPSKKTMVCLQTLLETKFVHFIDAPSLALIMPVVERAFQDRVTETRKMSAQIIGNMYSLTDQKDLDPYIDKVIPGLKQSLLDPVPEVRQVSAHALGAMVKGMSKDKFDALLKWLIDTLGSEGSSVDRSGAAQGLSEVIGGMGLPELDKLLPGIIQTAERTDISASIRDGYIMMYIYLPSVFGDNFLKYISAIIPSILQALADESEFVRDTALRAGQRIINMYADTAIELLLPELERGLFDDNWRIRFSSVQLLGDLLYRISGVSGKMSTEGAHEDDNFGTETSQQAIMGLLGKERRDRVLSGLYMGRSDTALLVRQSALHVWKIIVTNTPRTLREILSTLFTLLLGCLASTSHDKRQVAARTLGDLVKKLGERVLPEIIPILEKGLDSDQSDQRQGVCIGLSEIMASTSREHVSVYAESLIPTVQRALIDPLPEVREAAAFTFDSLHSNIGPRALDEILPDLLQKLNDERISERALDGLKQVMSVKSRVVLPYLVPQLTAPPVNTRALSFLSSVAGDALTRHLPKILPALLMSLSEKAGTDEESQELGYCRTVVLSVDDEAGVRTIMDELLASALSPSGDLSCASVTILHSFCDQTTIDYSDYIPQLFRGLISLFARSELKVLTAAYDCLFVVTKKLDTTEMFQHISNVRHAVRHTLSDFKGQELPGFSLPKRGITPVLPIFREGILNGSPEMKEQAAIGLGELINLTSAEALKPSVVNITGPLIRILGDRFTSNVKVAVLETLTLLLAKVGVILKPFLPQLQTTFVKALNDPNRAVRLKAAAALGKLIVIHTRVDPLFQELVNGIKNAEDNTVRDTMVQALRFCLIGAGSKMAADIRKQITVTLQSMLNANEDNTRTVSSGCLGALCCCLPEEELTDLLIQHILDCDSSLDWTLRHGRSVALFVALKLTPMTMCTPAYSQGIQKTITQLITSDKIPLSMSGLRALGFLMHHRITIDADVNADLVTSLAKGMKHDSNDVKQLAAKVVTFLAQSSRQPLPMPILKALVPAMVMGTKERNTAVRANSEFALVALLQLRKGESFLQSMLSSLDSGMQDSLKEVVSKSLKKISSQPEPAKEEIDDTILQ